MKTYEVTTRERVYREYVIERTYKIEAKDADQANDRACSGFDFPVFESERLNGEDRDRGSEEVTDTEDVTPEERCSTCGDYFPEDELEEHEKECEE